MKCWAFRPDDRDAGASIDGADADRLSALAGGSARSPQAASAEADSPLWAAFTCPPPTLFLGGEIDESTYRELRQVLEMAVETKRHLLQVDMTDVMYCDLAGLRAILLLAHMGRPGPARVDQLVLQHLPIQLRTAIRVLGWDDAPGLFLAEPVG